MRVVFGTVFGLVAAALIAAGTGLAHERTKGSQPTSPSSQMGEAPAACVDMMQGTGATEEGKKAMREFLESDHAPQAMANMTEMARRMGNGDVMLGMTRTMEMMGGQGGMMQ